MRLIDADAHPTADRPTGQWIPATERLPETPEKWWQKKDYLACFKGGYVLTVGWWDGWNCRMELDGTVDREHEMTDIIAWMPLPEPYKEADDEN